MSEKSLQKHYSIHEESERRAYSQWINKTLFDDTECSVYLPLDPYTDDLYSKIRDGVLLCKLLNASISNSIDERAINPYADVNDNYSKSMDNLCLVVNAARCRGANMGNADLNELYAGNKFAVLDAIWQIIRIGFLNMINIHHHPEIVSLKKNNESMDDLKEKSPLDIVLMYVNIHLAKSVLRHFINDYDDDFKDCLLYAHLTYRVAPVNLRMKMNALKPSNNTNDRVDLKLVSPSWHSVFIRGFPSNIQMENVRNLLRTEMNENCKIYFSVVLKIGKNDS